MDSAPAPLSTATAGELVDCMNRLRAWSGNPSLRTLRRLGGTTVTSAGEPVDALPTSTTSHLLNGRGLPQPPRWEFLEAYVTACLTAAALPADRIPDEISRWRTAWRALGTPAPPVVVPTRRRPVWVVSAVAVAVAFAGGIGVGVVVARPSPSPSLPAPGEPRRAAVARLGDIEGVDLDTGAVGHQDMPGADLSPWDKARRMSAKSGTRLALLAEAGPESYDRCVRDSQWHNELQLANVGTGRNVCVVTSEKRIGMLTLDRPAGEGSLAFRYVVWSTRPLATRGS